MHTIHAGKKTGHFRWGSAPDLIRSGLLAALLGGPLAAGAATAGTFTPPEGCTGYLTIQMVGCTVSNHYTCTGEAAGDKWRADFAQNGKVFESRINTEAEWVESLNFNPDSRDMLDLPAADPASMTELLTSGSDTYDFTTTSTDGYRKHIAGFDRLTGETVVIDGVTLKRTAYDAKAVDDAGTTVWHAKGNEYVDESRRIFVSGKGTWEGDDGIELPYDSTPMLFLMPGEKGFFTTNPLFDCEATLSESARPTLISAQGE